MKKAFRKNDIAICTHTTHAWRSVNEEELDAWYASDSSKGMDCAGESKLSPRDTYFNVDPGTIVHILKARVKVSQGYRMVSNCMEVMLSNGEVVNVEKRKFDSVV